MFQAKVVQKVKIHLSRSETFFFFRKLCRLWDKVENYCTVGEVSEDNMGHAYFTLGT